MKKNVFMCVVATFVCMVLMACSDNKHPFKAVSENMVDYLESVRKKPELMKDESHFKAFYEKQEKLCKELGNKTIDVEIEKGLGFELVSQKATIKRGTGESTLSIPIDIILKVVDEELAYKNSLMGLAYNDQDIVYAGYLDHINENGTIEYDEVDEDTEVIVLEERQSFQSPYKPGDILYKRITISINPFLAHQFVNVSKVVVTEYDSNLLSATRKKNEELEEKAKEEFAKQF